MPRSDEIASGLEASPAEYRALIALSLVPGVGPGRIRALLARFGTAGGVFDASPTALAAVPGIGPQTAEAITSFDAHDLVEEQLQRAIRNDVTLVPAWSAPFPSLLREIYDPPAFLWMRGTLDPADDQAIAIVGTRRSSEYGRHVAYDFAFALAQRGYTIVSGLAYGIDAAAHRGALDAKGRTLAVLGSGVDRVYPGRHKRLADDIACQGAVLSEYPLGAAPDAPNFPRRNRIISGLTRGTLVVEAYEQGGALITARMAVEQNREVFALPSPIQSRSGIGTNRLIQRGHAKLVLSVEDIVEELDGSMGTFTTAWSSAPATPLPTLHPVEQQLYDVLASEPQHIDILCRKTGQDASTVLVYLLGLEFKGLVRQLAGKQFCRC